MKKKISLLAISLLTIAALICLGGCSKKQAPDSSGTIEKEAGTPIVLRFVTDYPQTDYRAETLQGFADKVMTKTDGKVKIEMYYGGQLYKLDQYPDAFSTGAVDLGFPQFGKGWPSIIPEFTVLGSGIFTDYNHAMRVMEGPLGTELSQLLEKKANTKLLSWSGVGSADAICNNKRPLKKPEDMSGLMLRVASTAQTAYVEAFGASGVVMAPSEMYTAIQRGTVDGSFATTPTAAIALKLFEVAKYWTRIAVTGVAFEHGFIANLDTWNKLPADVQKVIEETAKETGKQIVDEAMATTEKEWDAVKNAPGAEVYIIPAGEVAQWTDKAASVREQVLKKVLSPERIKELYDMVDQVK